MREDFLNKMQPKTTCAFKLNLKTLYAIMWVSLCGLEVYAMDWTTFFNIWRNMQDRKKLTLD